MSFVTTQKTAAYETKDTLYHLLGKTGNSGWKIKLNTYIHILYLNTIWFKAQNLWGRVKMTTNG